MSESNITGADKLLPCPFCGGEVQFRKALWPADGDVDAVIHKDVTLHCGLSHFSNDSVDEQIIAAWNRRAPQAGPPMASEDGKLLLWAGRYADHLEREGWPNHASVMRQIAARFLEIKTERSAITVLVEKQAEDHSLWFVAATITEDILQQALRRLHAAVEGPCGPADAPQAARAAGVSPTTEEGK